MVTSTWLSSSLHVVLHHITLATSNSELHHQLQTQHILVGGLNYYSKTKLNFSFVLLKVKLDVWKLGGWFIVWIETLAAVGKVCIWEYFGGGPELNCVVLSIAGVNE